MVFRAIPREAEPRSRYNDTSAALSNASEQVPSRPETGAARDHILVPRKCRSHDSPANRSQAAYAALRRYRRLWSHIAAASAQHSTAQHSTEQPRSQPRLHRGKLFLRLWGWTHKRGLWPNVLFWGEPDTPG